MNIYNKKVLVFGSGMSGIGASRLLEQKGAQVILYDGNETLDRQEIRSRIGPDSKAEVLLGSAQLTEHVMESLDLAVLSPGVPTDVAQVCAMKEQGIPIIGEVELAYRYGKGDVIAITGTNGKTTTTALVGEIMRNFKSHVFVVGNIGKPYTEVVDEMADDAVTVAEVSSFQLETVDTFHAKVSAFLNISEDHLDRHHTMQAYIEVKKKIVINQTETDACVLNYEDEVTRKFGELVRPYVLYFSSRRKLDRGVYLDAGNIIYRNDGRKMLICHVDELKLLGIHNYENVMAAVAIGIVYGVPMAVIQESIKAFAGVEHRIEFVGERQGVVYYNDSKATNSDAAIKGIRAMNRPTVLIGGGYDKDAVYKEWIESFDGKVTYLVLLGATKEKIEKEARECGFDKIVLVDTLEEAVLQCAKLAKPGDAVLLSPACASWGMFKSFEERGDKFKQLVNYL